MPHPIKVTEVPYGGGYKTGRTDTVCTLADTDYKVNAVFTEWQSQLVEFDAVLNRFKYKGHGHAVKIDIDLTGSVSNGATVKYVIHRNGVAVPGAVRTRSFQNSNEYGALSVSSIIQAATDDYFELFVNCDSAGVTVSTTEIQLTIL